MKFCFFGLSLTSSWGNGHATTYRGLLAALRRLGHQIDFFERDVEWYAARRDLPQPPQARLHLYREWSDIAATALAMGQGADAVVVGSYFPDSVALLDKLLVQRAAPVCFYDIDTPITLDDLRRQRCRYLRAEHIPEFDLYLSFTGGPVLEELQSRWKARRVRTLYCACDELSYLRTSKRASSVPAVAKLSFMGTYAPDRQAKLQTLFLEPARLLPQHHFAMAGSMYPAPCNWPENVRYQSHLAPGSHAAFYSASEFTLNLTRQAMVEAGYSPSIRLFEAASCGTAVISDPWPGLDEFFEPGAEILVANDSDAVVDILSHATPADAERIGNAARERVLSAHTSRHRAVSLLSYFDEIT
ncbi:MAG TPA: glycosyltransferase [Terriglobales bacterium]|nr:glycosyltransferase [Terriglobales bacterium]